MNPYHRIQEEERAKKKREALGYIQTLQPHLLGRDIAIGVENNRLITFCRGVLNEKTFRTQSLALTSFERFRKEFCTLLPR